MDGAKLEVRVSRQSGGAAQYMIGHDKGSFPGRQYAEQVATMHVAGDNA
jgi:hypothetical protein